MAPQYLGFKPPILVLGLQGLGTSCPLASRPTAHFFTLSLPASLGFSQALGTSLLPQPPTVLVLVHSYVTESLNKLYPLQLLGF